MSAIATAKAVRIIERMIDMAFVIAVVVVAMNLLSFALIFDRHYIGIATAVNLLLLGYVVQFTYDFLLGICPEPTMLVRILSLTFSFFVLCFASSVYMTADMGVSTYDAIALVMAYKWKIWKFKYIRICTDLVCVILGIVLFIFGKGAIKDIPAFVGVGTILTAFFMGPLIDFFNRKVACKMLGEEKK